MSTLLSGLFAVSVSAALSLYRLAGATLRHQPLTEPKLFRITMILAISAILICVSLPALLGVPKGEMYVVRPNLINAEISTKPPNWTDSPADVASVKGALLGGRNLRYADARYAFLVKANLNSADLTGANLGSADLREAQLTRAELGAANLSETNLQGAEMERANLHQAFLVQANFQKANLWLADLSGAEASGSWLPVVPGSNLTPDQMPISA
jgi:uncharacterized protein YjbI with pentapeptide repeats